MSTAGSAASWTPAVLLGAQYAGAMLLSLAAGGLVVRSGALAPEPAALAGAVAIPAWTAGALAAASWSIGFDEADAGLARSWFGSATLEFAAVAWALGAISVAVAVAATLRRPSNRVGRSALAAVVAVPAAFTVGVATLIPTATVLLSALVLVLCTVHTRSRRPAAATPAHRPRPLAPRVRRRLAATSAALCLVGLGCVAFALAGSVLVPAAGDSTRTMQIGITVGSIAAVGTVLTASAALRPRFGNAVVWPTVTLVAGLGLVAISYATDTNGPLGWPLLVAAATLVGVTGALLFRPLLPRDARARAALVAAIGVALAASVGFMTAMLAAFAAPVLAAAIAVVLLRRPRSRPDPRMPAPAARVS
ncbi:hypothetical protein ACEXQB_014860 [Herbiconiux sp. P18]|uniref:hypothetical protein n=1 Tax=Herbiconiux liangxiaofengii TaxID=3342795 RepID=UPI0035BC7168